LKRVSAANTFDVAIAGAGPAGTSAAIQLALSGARVLLVEEKKFPRAKLCGEFISPECLAHFQRLGVMEQMTAAAGVALSETVFYSRWGNSVAVPSEWFKAGTQALGLSRREMDLQLLERAKSAGVVVLEETHASRPVYEDNVVRGIHMKAGNAGRTYEALVTIDATGRTRSLARHLDPPRVNRDRQKSSLVAFKVHLENARVASGACEIYFYKRGYGGLSGVEGGVSNLCFIVAAADVRSLGSDPERVLKEVVMKNSRAAYTLAEARTHTAWLSVALESFGRRTLVPAAGMLAAGDAAAFIDPFTGSGMLMALESGQLAADVIMRRLARLQRGDGFASLANEYRAEYHRRFDSRLRVSGLLRRAAFFPNLAEAAIFLSGASSGLRRKLARATRSSRSHEVKAPSV
jgi:flavin-dependent dehydrogenase